jgi:hypothetical protein
MSKKLIAVASAAALALTALVGVAPASATVATVTWTSASGTGTAADPFTRAVPSANGIISATNAQIIDIANLAAGDTVTVSSSGTAKIIGDVVAASTVIDVKTLGAATLTKTPSGSLPATSGTASALKFYVFDTKADSASTITVTVNETDAGVKRTNTSTSVYEASVGPIHNVVGLSAPASLAAAADGEVTFKLTDVFGNEIDQATITANLGSAFFAPTFANTSGAGAVSGPTYSVARKLWVAKVTAPTNTRPFIVTVDGNGSSNDGPGNAGLGSSTTDNNLVVINNTGAAAQQTALATQVAALTAQVAKRVSKKKYNTLARKWNAAFPSQKVALKK